MTLPEWIYGISTLATRLGSRRSTRRSGSNKNPWTACSPFAVSRGFALCRARHLRFPACLGLALVSGNRDCICVCAPRRRAEEKGVCGLCARAWAAKWRLYVGCRAREASAPA